MPGYEENAKFISTKKVRLIDKSWGSTHFLLHFFLIYLPVPVMWHLTIWGRGRGGAENMLHPIRVENQTFTSISHLPHTFCTQMPMFGWSLSDWQGDIISHPLRVQALGFGTQMAVDLNLRRLNKRVNVFLSCATHQPNIALLEHSISCPSWAK